MTFFKSVRFALRGIAIVWKEERNFRIQTIIGAFVIFVALVVPLKNWEIVVVCLLVASVLVLEIMNTIVERLIDMLKPRLHDFVAVIKDMMAAAVLIASLASTVVGGIIFLPYFIALVIQ